MRHSAQKYEFSAVSATVLCKKAQKAVGLSDIYRNFATD
jgi:hypothetical protein